MARDPELDYATANGGAVEENRHYEEEEDEIIDEEEEDEDVEEEEEDEESEDFEESFRWLISYTREYRKEIGLPISEFELGLKSLDRSKARALEKELRDVEEVESKLREQRSQLLAEFSEALAKAVDGC